MESTSIKQNCVDSFDETTETVNVLQHSSSHVPTHILPKCKTSQEIFLDEIISQSAKNYLIIGKRGTGVTDLALDLAQKLTNKNFIKSIYVYVNSQPTQQQYQFNLSVVKNIYSEFNTSFTEALVNKQKANPVNPILLVLDDVISTNINNIKMFDDIIKNGRHYKIYTIITMQYPMQIKPDLRANFDNVFVFPDSVITHIKRIYEYYFGFGDFLPFQKLMVSLDNSQCVCTTNTMVHANKQIHIYKPAPVINSQSQNNSEEKISDYKFQLLNPDNVFTKTTQEKKQVIIMAIKTNNQIIAQLMAQNASLNKLLE